MDEIIITGRIKNGKLMFAQPQGYNDFCRINDGQRVVMKMSPLGHNATESQKGYYRKVVVPIYKKLLNNAGMAYGEIETDLWLKENCPYTRQEDYVGDEVCIHPPMDADCIDRRSWSQLIEWSINFAAAEFGEIIPEPN